MPEVRVRSLERTADSAQSVMGGKTKPFCGEYCHGDDGDTPFDPDKYVADLEWKVRESGVLGRQADEEQEQPCDKQQSASNG